MHDLDLTVRAAGLNGIPLLGNGGSVDDPATPDRWARVLGWWSSRSPPQFMVLLVRVHRASLPDSTDIGGLPGCCCLPWAAGSTARSALQRPPSQHRTRLAACRENNVEQVTLDSLPGGPVAITVRGHSVFGEGGMPQYALVVNGDFRWGRTVGHGCMPPWDACSGRLLRDGWLHAPARCSPTCQWPGGL